MLFGIFKSKPEKALQKKYAALMKEGFRLSTINRAQSAEKYYEADLVLKEIEQLAST